MHRRPYKIMALIVLASLISLCVVSPVSADAAPKPSLHFTLKFDTETEPAVESATLLMCEDRDCRNAYALEQDLGPQGMYCSGNQCTANLAYDRAEYMKLQLSFDDGVTRESQIFTATRFQAYFAVTVSEYDLDVRQTGGMNSILLVVMGWAVSLMLLIGGIVLLVITGIRAKKEALTFQNSTFIYILIWVLALAGTLNGVVVMPSMPLTFILESIIILGYATNQKENRTTWITQVLLVNLITQPLLITSVMQAGMNNGRFLLWMGIAEVIVFVAEMAMFKLWKREEIGWLQAAIISIIINAASFAVGWLLPI